MNGSLHRFGARQVLSAVGAAAALATLGACGGSSPGYSAPPAAAASGVAPAPSDSSMPSMTTSAPGQPGQPGATAGAPVASNTAMIQNFAFAPPSIAVKVGATLTWTNADEDPHTVAATGGAFRSPTLTSGATFSYTFTTAGTFDYVCTIHPFMHATVVVTP